MIIYRTISQEAKIKMSEVKNKYWEKKKNEQLEKQL